MIPIFKKGDHNVATNYRPISFLSLIDKIFEKLDYIRVSSYHKKYKLLSKNQFGFREFRTAYLLLICRFEVAWRMEHSRYFFPREWIMQIHAYSSLYAYAEAICLRHDHTITLLPLAEPYVSTLPAEPNPPKRNEAETRTEPKTSAALPARCSSCAL